MSTRSFGFSFLLRWRSGMTPSMRCDASVAEVVDGPSHVTRVWRSHVMCPGAPHDAKLPPRAWPSSSVVAGLDCLFRPYSDRAQRPLARDNKLKQKTFS